MIEKFCSKLVFIRFLKVKKRTIHKIIRWIKITSCIEYYGNRFHRKYSKLLRIDFFGFDGQDNYDKALNLLQNKSIKCFRYHEIKSFIKEVTDVPENYLFYESF